MDLMHKLSGGRIEDPREELQSLRDDLDRIETEARGNVSLEPSTQALFEERQADIESQGHHLAPLLSHLATLSNHWVFHEHDEEAEESPPVESGLEQ